MNLLVLLILLLLLFGWGGYWVGPYRGNSLAHLLLVLFVVIILFHLLTGRRLF